MSLNNQRKNHNHGHLVHVLLPMIYICIWILDSFIFNFSAFIADYIPLFTRVILCIVTLAFAFYLWGTAHKVLFGKLFNPPRHRPEELATTGIFAYIRHPMYLGNILALLSIFFLSFSLLSLLCVIIIFLIFNHQAAKEDQFLEETYGEFYLCYKTKVHRWVPRLTRYQTN